MTSPTGTVQGF